jgi:putative FmdB family regulatory protein
MPLYEYKCSSCGKTFEVIQKFADEPLTVHPECGGEVVRLFSAPAFHLKGTGWYATDYAKKSNGGPKSESDSKPKDDAKPAATTESKESKPAATTETKPSTTP